MKAGTLDDVNALANVKPVAELYTESRVDWIPAIEGAAQKIAMG